jgi:hypothetical protein
MGGPRREMAWWRERTTRSGSPARGECPGQPNGGDDEVGPRKLEAPLRERVEGIWLKVQWHIRALRVYNKGEARLVEVSNWIPERQVGLCAPVYQLHSLDVSQRAVQESAQRTGPVD